MTYQINHNTSMVLTDVCDAFTADPMLTFISDGKDVPVSAVIPSIRAIDIQEDPIVDTYTAELTNADGQVYVLSFPTLESIATYLMLAAQGAAEPTVDAPAPTVTDDTTTATEAASEAQEATYATPVEFLKYLATTDLTGSDTHTRVSLENAVLAMRYARGALEKFERGEKAGKSGDYKKEFEYMRAAKSKLSRARELYRILLQYEELWKLDKKVSDAKYIEGSTYKSGIKFEAEAVLEILQDYPSFIEWCRKDGPIASTKIEQAAIARARYHEYQAYIDSQKSTDPADATVDVPAPTVTSDTAPATDTTSEAQEPVQEPAESHAGTHMYAEICFTGFITDSTGKRVEVKDLEAAKAWAAEHPEAVFGDIEVAVWQFLHKDLRGNFIKRCIVVRWAGEDRCFYQLGDDFFRRCWDNMLAMGHTIHPMPEDQRAAPHIESSVDFVDVTHEYFPSADAATEPTDSVPAPQVTDDTTQPTDDAQTAPEPSEPTAEEAAASAGISIEPFDGATEILICGGSFLESTKLPLMTICWRDVATDFNLSHVVFRAWTTVDPDDPVGYMRACDRVKDYYNKYCPRDTFERMTLDVLHEHYPNGEADIKDEFDERAVAQMRRLEQRYQDHAKKIV